MGFSPRHVAPINVKFGTGERTIPRCQISRLSGQKCGNTALKTVKISNFGQKFVLQGRLVCNIFYEILSICTPLQVPFKFLVWSLSRDKHPSYKHFPAVGDFPTNFQWPLAAKLLIASKKVSGVRKWDGPPLSPCEVWWGSWVARRLQTKCDVFLSVSYHALE